MKNLPETVRSGSPPMYSSRSKSTCIMSFIDFTTNLKTRIQSKKITDVLILLVDLQNWFEHFKYRLN